MKVDHVRYFFPGMKTASRHGDFSIVASVLSSRQEADTATCESQELLTVLCVSMLGSPKAMEFPKRKTTSKFSSVVSCLFSSLSDNMDTRFSGHLRQVRLALGLWHGGQSLHASLLEFGQAAWLS